MGYGQLNLHTFKFSVETMDNVQKNAFTDYNAPSSEPFTLHLYNQYGPGIYPIFRKLERVMIQLAITHSFFYLKMEEDPASET
jgi:hypothetical protein